MSLQKILPDQNWTFSYWVTSQLQDISLTALGLHTYLMSLPDGWDISCIRIAQERKEGRDAIRSALAELRQAGLAETTKVQEPDGRFKTVTKIYAIPKHLISVKPQVAPETDFQGPDKPAGRTGAWKTGLRSSRPLRKKTIKIKPPPTPQEESQSQEPAEVKAEGGEDQKEEDQKPSPTTSELVDELIETLKRGPQAPGKIHIQRLTDALTSLVEAGADPARLKKALEDGIESARHWFGAYVARAESYRPADYVPKPRRPVNRPRDSVEPLGSHAVPPAAKALIQEALKAARAPRGREVSVAPGSRGESALMVGSVDQVLASLPAAK